MVTHFLDIFTSGNQVLKNTEFFFNNVIELSCTSSCSPPLPLFNTFTYLTTWHTVFLPRNIEQISLGGVSGGLLVQTLAQVRANFQQLRSSSDNPCLLLKMCPHKTVIFWKPR